jgi:hypothetical protein
VVLQVAKNTDILALFNTFITQLNRSICSDWIVCHVRQGRSQRVPELPLGQKIRGGEYEAVKLFQGLKIFSPSGHSLSIFLATPLTPVLSYLLKLFKTQYQKISVTLIE